MTTAEKNILCYLEAHGSTTYVKLCDHFNLMAKKHIEDALHSLMADGKITTDPQQPRAFWSTKTGKAPMPSTYDSVREWVRKRHTFTTEQFRAAMPAKKSRAVEYLGVLAEKGEIASAGRGLWTTNTPSEATRDAGAPATTDVPEAVATPEPVGDAPVVSAEDEPAGNGAGGADQWDPEMLRKLEEEAFAPMPLPRINPLFRSAQAPVEEAMDAYELRMRDNAEPYSILRQAKRVAKERERARSARAKFRMTNGAVTIVIRGSPSEVSRVAALLDKALMA